MDFEIDYSRLDFAGLADGISMVEIVSVHTNDNSRWRELPGFPLQLFYTIQTGYSKKKRMLMIFSRIIELKRQILAVKVAEEFEVELYYCNDRKKY
jgi:hypothetical protein